MTYTPPPPCSQAHCCWGGITCCHTSDACAPDTLDTYTCDCLVGLVVALSLPQDELVGAQHLA